MAQKVITVVSYADINIQGKFEELDFPKLSEALQAGYTVKEIKPIPLQGGGSTTLFVITFVLEKNTSQGTSF